MMPGMSALLYCGSAALYRCTAPHRAPRPAPRCAPAARGAPRGAEERAGSARWGLRAEPRAGGERCGRNGRRGGRGRAQPAELRARPLGAGQGAVNGSRATGGVEPREEPGPHRGAALTPTGAARRAGPGSDARPRPSSPAPARRGRPRRGLPDPGPAHGALSRPAPPRRWQQGAPRRAPPFPSAHLRRPSSPCAADAASDQSRRPDGRRQPMGA